MGYSFTLERPHDGVASGCAFNLHQMRYVRLIMAEAGAIGGDGMEAVIGGPGLETCADTLPPEKFSTNAGWHITAHEAAFIATRLRRAVELNAIGDLLMFLDDRPESADLRKWVEEFAAFNEHASRLDGYYVC